MYKTNKLIKIFILIAFFQTYIASPNNQLFLGGTELEEKLAIENRFTKLENEVKSLRNSNMNKVDKALSITLKVLAIITLTYLMYHFWPTKD